MKYCRFFHIKSVPGKKKSSASTSNSMALVPVTPLPVKRYGSDDHQARGGDDGTGGIHMGGTPTPPLSSTTAKVDCEPPYR